MYVHTHILSDTYRRMEKEITTIEERWIKTHNDMSLNLGTQDSRLVCVV